MYITSISSSHDPQANEMLHHKANLNGYLSYHTGQSLEKINQDTDRDFFMSAKEAKDYGLIDGVIMNPLKALQPLPASVDDNEQQQQPDAWPFLVITVAINDPFFPYCEFDENGLHTIFEFVSMLKNYFNCITESSKNICFAVSFSWFRASVKDQIVDIVPCSLCALWLIIVMIHESCFSAPILVHVSLYTASDR